MSLGRNIDLVGHQRILVDQIDPAILSSINNIVYKSTDVSTKWIEETTVKIGDWRAIFRSIYIRWALSINGLHVANERYISSKEEKSFYINSLRMDNGTAKQTKIAEWDFPTAAEAHIKTLPMLSAYGLIDLYGCFEEFIFDFYRIFLKHNPTHLLSGDENKALKKLYKASLAHPTLVVDFNEKFNDRLNTWQRKRLYDGLGKVFLAYCHQADIQKPSAYKHTTPETWSQTLSGIGLIRNALTHGAKTASKELADFCATPYNNGFTFKEGDSLEIELFHLQATEMFSDQLLNALNISLFELAERYEKQRSSGAGLPT